MFYKLPLRVVTSPPPPPPPMPLPPSPPGPPCKLSRAWCLDAQGMGELAPQTIRFKFHCIYCFRSVLDDVFYNHGSRAQHRPCVRVHSLPVAPFPALSHPRSLISPNASSVLCVVQAPAPTGLFDNAQVLDSIVCTRAKCELRRGGPGTVCLQ